MRAFGRGWGREWSRLRSSVSSDAIPYAPCIVSSCRYSLSWNSPIRSYTHRLVARRRFPLHSFLAPFPSSSPSPESCCAERLICDGYRLLKSESVKGVVRREFKATSSAGMR